MYKELLCITLFVVGVAIASMLGLLSAGSRFLKTTMSTAAGLSANLMAAAAAGATPYSTAFVTVPNQDVAKTIARGLVKNKLAACVNIIPNIVSIYEWEGSISEDAELLLMIKTRTSKIEELTKFVRENHPYSVCEVIATSIEKGNPAYLDWIGTSVPELSLDEHQDQRPTTSS